MVIPGSSDEFTTTKPAAIVILSSILTFPITFVPTPNLTLSPIIGLSNVYPLFQIQLDPCKIILFSARICIS